MTDNNINEERELGWDDEIENDGADYILLEEDDYNFKIELFERGRHQGSDNLPPCHKAILHVRIYTDQIKRGHITLKHNLFLHTKTEGLLCQFFKSIGHRQHGERVKMDWNTVPGATGQCHVGIREWTDNNGTKRKSNQITKFLETSNEPVSAGYTPGKF